MAKLENIANEEKLTGLQEEAVYKILSEYSSLAEKNGYHMTLAADDNEIRIYLFDNKIFRYITDNKLFGWLGNSDFEDFKKQLPKEYSLGESESTKKVIPIKVYKEKCTRFP